MVVCTHLPLASHRMIAGGHWAFDLYFLGTFEAVASTPEPSADADITTSDKQLLLDLHNEAR